MYQCSCWARKYDKAGIAVVRVVWETRRENRQDWRDRKVVIIFGSVLLRGFAKIGDSILIVNCKLYIKSKYSVLRKRTSSPELFLISKWNALGLRVLLWFYFVLLLIRSKLGNDSKKKDFYRILLVRRTCFSNMCRETCRNLVFYSVEYL